MLQESIVLIDAFSQIFRAFYAIRHLSNSRGEPVNALLVFTRLLIGIEKNYPGRRGAMLFDSGKVRHRLELLPEYKANRPPMPELLAQQIPFIREMSSAFGWQMLSADDYEADDLIGVLAKNLDGDIRIISSDKDLSQLIDERVKMLTPANGSTGGFEERDAAAVKDKFGVSPELIIDYLALLGDSSDNIDGVKGIGAKGAAELLNTCGASCNWIDDISKVPAKFASKLSAGAEILRRNIKLVSLRTDLPEGWSDPEKMVIRKSPDWAEIRRLCRHYGLKSILKDIPEQPDIAEQKQETVCDKFVPAQEEDLFSFMQRPVEEPEKKVSSVQNDGTDGEKAVQGELFSL